MTTFILKLIIFTSIGVYSFWNMKFPSYFYIKPNDGVNLRSEANINSTRITTIKKGEEVYVTDNSFEETQLNGLKGKWLKVKYNSNEGYIFNAYLEEESGTSKFIRKNILSIFGSIIFFFGIISAFNAEKKRKEEQKLYKEFKEAEEAILQDYAKEYGEETAKAIRNKEPKIGMTQDMIEFMFNLPDKINVSEKTNKKTEEFLYNPYVYRKKTEYKMRFVIENGILVQYYIEDKKEI